MVILLLLSFISTFIIVKKIKPFGYSNRGVFILTVLFFSLVLVLITEALSFFGKLSYLTLSIFWFIYSILGVYTVIRNYRRIINQIKLLPYYFSYIKKPVNKFEGFVLVAISFFLIGIFVQGLIYPPNNYDSMTYHMSRVSHWVNNGSVDHYPTHIYRQLYQPPFAEFFITHTVILQKSDVFANSIQFFFLIASLIIISLIAAQLGLSKRMQIVVSLMALMTPEIILQGSSTQNDIVVSFFLLTCIYYTIEAIKTKRLLSIIAVGLSAGLALLTKGTAYIYVFPPMLFLAFSYIYSISKIRKYILFSHGLVILFIVTVINLGHTYRNFSLSGNILGINEQIQNLYSNEEVTLSGIGSNAVRNLALHLGPYPLSIISEKAIVKLHMLFGLNLSDKKITFGKANFFVPIFPSHEDSAPNLPQIILFLIALVWGGRYFYTYSMRSNKILLYLFLVLILQYFLFCAYLKWQPWHSRLHTPLFFLMAPILIFIYDSISRKITGGILCLCFIYSINILLFNSTRPYITLPFGTSKINVFDSKAKKYFSNRMDLYKEYSEMKSYLSNKNFHRIGLMLGSNSWEYPLINEFDKEPPITFSHINLKNNNISREISTNKKDINYIVSDTKEASITYDSELFIRKMDGEHLFLYEKSSTIER